MVEVVGGLENRLIRDFTPYLGSMSLKKAAFWLLIAFGVFFLINSPRQAADLVQGLGENAGHWFGVAGKSLARFLESLG